MNEAIIIAGGLGTRLRQTLPDLPKVMALVRGRPFLEYILHFLSDNGFDRVVLAVGYMHEEIRSVIGNNYLDMEVVYSVEDEPLGTGGALLRALSCINSRICLALNGDSVFHIDIGAFREHFDIFKPAISIALKPMENFSRYGNVTLEGSRIISFEEKEFCEKGYINGGVYILRKEWLVDNSPGNIFSFEKDILEKMTRNSLITGYVSDAYFIDIGIPEDYSRAGRELGDLPD